MKVLIWICMTEKEKYSYEQNWFQTLLRDNYADSFIKTCIFLFKWQLWLPLCVPAGCPVINWGGGWKKWNQEFLSEQQDPGAALREGVIVQHFHHNARHMENRRISHWLPAWAKANTNPHMHRSGHLELPHFTITTDETQESFCFPEVALFPGLATSRAGSVCGRINLGAQALV